MKINSELCEFLMQQALLEARKAYELGEVPVGAVLAKGQQIIARAHNLVEKQFSVSKHAEILVLDQAGQQLADWRLNDYTLCVTLEPCSMCASAIKLARVGTVIFGASDPSMGACGSIYDLISDPRFGAVPRVISGVASLECGQLLSEFFKSKR